MSPVLNEIRLAWRSSNMRQAQEISYHHRLSRIDPSCSFVDMNGGRLPGGSAVGDNTAVDVVFSV